MKRFVLAWAVSAVLLGCSGSVSTGGAGGHASTTGTGATSTTAATTTSSSSGGTTTASSTGSGVMACATDADCGPLLQCCGGVCGNAMNDIANCGGCGKKCAGPNPFCAAGTCGTPPCNTPQLCGAAALCCDTQCCPAGQLCCDVPGPGPTMGLKCTDPVNGTCPAGCPACD